QETEYTRQQQSRKIGGRYLRPRSINLDERRLRRIASQAAVVFNPLAGHIAEIDTECSNRVSEIREGVRRSSVRRQRHHVSGFVDVSSAQFAKVAEKPAVVLVADKRITVALEEF